MNDNKVIAAVFVLITLAVSIQLMLWPVIQVILYILPTNWILITKSPRNRLSALTIVFYLK